MSRVVDIHTRYYDASGTRRNETFDVEEYDEGLIDFNKIVTEYLEDGATDITIHIDTERTSQRG